MTRCDATSDRWRLNGHVARLASGNLTAEIDVRRPHRGLTNLRMAGESVAGSLLAVDVEPASPSQADSNEPWTPADVYARGSDLVATYHEPRGQPFTLQIYWRLVAPGAAGAATLEAIVSVQTRQWETYPHVTIRSSLAGSDAIVTDHGAIYRSEGGWSYVEASLPDDFTAEGADKPTSGASSVAWTYGEHFMERGVIRRLRLRGAFVPAGDADRAAQQLLTDLAAEQPPLTA